MELKYRNTLSDSWNALYNWSKQIKMNDVQTWEEFDSEYNKIMSDILGLKLVVDRASDNLSDWCEETRKRLKETIGKR